MTDKEQSKKAKVYMLENFTEKDVDVRTGLNLIMGKCLLVVIIFLCGYLIIAGIGDNILFRFITITMVILCVVMTLVCYKIEENQKNDSKVKIKEIGRKENAHITEVGSYFTGYYHRPIEHHYITISQEKNKNKKLEVKDNKAFKILKLLLDPYPVKKDIKVPIDIYVYKNKIYVDLESVELSKVNGYNEAEKIVNT